MNGLFLFISVYAKVHLAPIVDLQGVIHKDHINLCIFKSSCIATLLFFLLHSHELVPTGFVYSCLKMFMLAS
jgi:hypothetical protein